LQQSSSTLQARRSKRWVFPVPYICTSHQQAFLCFPAPDGSPLNGDSKTKVQTSSLFLHATGTWTGTSACLWALAMWAPHTLPQTACFPEKKIKFPSLKIKFSFLECQRGSSWGGRYHPCTLPHWPTTEDSPTQRRPLAMLASQHARRAPALAQPLVDNSELRTLTFRRRGRHGRPELQLPRDTLLVGRFGAGMAQPFPHPSLLQFSTKSKQPVVLVHPVLPQKNAL